MLYKIGTNSFINMHSNYNVGLGGSNNNFFLILDIGVIKCINIGIGLTFAYLF